MERFPEAPAPEAGPEWDELRALGEELQQHGAAVPVSADFAESLRGRLEERPWELRTALRERPLLRAAAALLVVSTIGAPVSALVLMLRPSPEPDPVLSWEQVLPPPEVVEEHRPELHVVPPQVPGFEQAFDADWEASLAQSNRTAVMQAQWYLAHADAAERTASTAPALLDWTQATEAQLIAEFERRALLGLTKPLPASLLERIEAQLALMPLADQAPAVQAWHWILHGEGPPPVPQLFR